MKFCPPAGGITNGQGIRIALKYLRENPEKLHEDQTLLLIWSLQSFFSVEFLDPWFVVRMLGIQRLLQSDLGHLR